jgi:hypothetical protein
MRAASWIPARVFTPIGRESVILYDGPSRIDRTPILLIAGARNGNRKIGDMLQLWIMLKHISPIDAVTLGRDSAICGDCSLRGDGNGKHRSCYVEWWRVVENIWQTRERLPRWPPKLFGLAVRDVPLRITGYGDPTAIPIDVWQQLLGPNKAGWTAYTQHWRRHPEFREHFMASVTTLDQQREAVALGWRTYRMRPTVEDPIDASEIVCPASAEAGHRVTCDRCELCQGASKNAKSIVIAAHGQRAVHFIARSRLVAR